MMTPPVQQFCTTHTLLLLLAFIYTTTSQVIVKTATLTPSNTLIDGARVVSNINEVQTVNDQWSVKIYSHKTWQFILSLDKTYGFNPFVRSLISVSMDATSLSTNALLFGFTTDNTHYVSMTIPMDNLGRSNFIYPACIPSLRSTQSFGIGDIASLPDTNRKCDIAGGSCHNWRNMIPTNHAYDAYMPITFIFEHFPAQNLLEVYYEDSSSHGLIQRCTFGAGYTMDNGLKVYIAGANPTETFAVSSFDILSITYHPTPSPTREPTPQPTPPTLNPTRNPTEKPSYAPTDTTSYPTRYPTGNPTNTPSFVPTVNPTNVPTLYPTNTPSFVPTLNPTHTPSFVPTLYPTPNPTNVPTFTPTNVPTDISQQPSLAPIRQPTVQTLYPTPIPTYNPTLGTDNPTAHPSTIPTSTPTVKPIQAGFVWGAFDQLCPESVTITGYCRDVTDIYYGSSVSCLQPYSCCMCASIECGFRGTPCGRVTIGTSGVYGVKDIRIAGNAVGIAGATLDCQGAASCQSSNISASNVVIVDCDGDQSCQNATIVITDPKPDFALECSGIESCHNLEIEINLSALPPSMQCVGLGNMFKINKIICNTDRACEGLQITINNAGCDKVMIETLECMKPNACDGAVFNLIGDIEIQNCKCGPSCSNAVGLEQCFLGLEVLLCVDPFACAFQAQTIINPRTNFEFVCSDVSSCQGGNFLIQMTPTIAKPVMSLAKFVFGGEDSARDATFIIDNRQGILMSLDLIECGGKNACSGTTFVLGSNVFVENIICASNACAGCMIQRTPSAPVLPCDPTSF